MTADAILFVWGKVHGGCFEWEAIRGGPLDGAREMWRGFSSACVERCSSRRTKVVNPQFRGWGFLSIPT